MEPNHVKPFKLEEVIDGSTFMGMLDLGLDIWVRRKVKLISVKCHGINVVRGLEAKRFVESFLAGKRLFVQTFRDRFGKYSTVLGVLYAKNGSGHINLNDMLIEKELASTFSTHGS